MCQLVPCQSKWLEARPAVSATRAMLPLRPSSANVIAGSLHGAKQCYRKRYKRLCQPHYLQVLSGRHDNSRACRHSCGNWPGKKVQDKSHQAAISNTDNCYLPTCCYCPFSFALRLCPTIVLAARARAYMGSVANVSSRRTPIAQLAWQDVGSFVWARMISKVKLAKTQTRSCKQVGKPIARIRRIQESEIPLLTKPCKDKHLLSSDRLRK